MADVFEEQYLLRVQDRTLAARLNRVLAEDAAARPGDADIKLDFVGEGTVLHNEVFVLQFPSQLWTASK
jgi:hypothetical protein